MTCKFCGAGEKERRSGPKAEDITYACGTVEVVRGWLAPGWNQSRTCREGAAVAAPAELQKVHDRLTEVERRLTSLDKGLADMGWFGADNKGL